MKKICALLIFLAIITIFTNACIKSSNDIDLTDINLDKVNESINKELEDETKGTHAIFYRNTGGVVFGFMIHGHSGYAESGSDIVCSAISALSFNAVNSIDRFTSDKVLLEQKDGFIKCILIGKMSKESELLMKSTYASMEDVQSQYEEYFNVKYVEVK